MSNNAYKFCRFKAEVRIDVVDHSTAFAEITRLFPSFLAEDARVVKEHIPVGHIVKINTIRCSVVGTDKARGNAFFDEGYTDEVVKEGEKYIISAVFCERFIENSTGGVETKAVASLESWNADRKAGEETREKLKQARREAEKLRDEIYRVKTPAGVIMRSLGALAHTFGMLNEDGDKPTIEWPDGVFFQKLVRGKVMPCDPPTVPDSIIEEVVRASRSELPMITSNRYRPDPKAVEALENLVVLPKAGEDPGRSQKLRTA